MTTIIVDIDGTLLRSGIYPIRKTIEWINERSSKYTIAIVTGRPRSTESKTRTALKDAGVKFNSLHMNSGSTNMSNQYKRQEAEKINAKNKVVLAIDNDAGARAAYKSVGIKTVSPTGLSGTLLASSKLWRIR